VTGGTPFDGLDDLAAELDPTFLAELGERLPRMEVALADLDSAMAESERGSTLEELTRHAHSIKGGAMLVGRDEIASLAAALEAYFPGQAAANPADWRAEDVRAALELMGRLGTTDKGSPQGERPQAAAEVERLVSALGEGKRRP
jgi:chemotaxis protein histidine kinase CheA